MGKAETAREMKGEGMNNFAYLISRYFLPPHRQTPLKIPRQKATVLFFLLTQNKTN